MGDLKRTYTSSTQFFPVSVKTLKNPAETPATDGRYILSAFAISTRGPGLVQSAPETTPNEFYSSGPEHNERKIRPEKKRFPNLPAL
jgi:hypothetical protein